MHNKTTSILFAIATWSLLLLRFGYQYGTGDQVELLPYTLFLHNPLLYPHDFFIQGLNASIPNERTVMAYLLLPFVNHLELVCFLLQFLVTVILVLGLEQLALRFIKNRYIAWLAILTALIPLNDFTLGNVDLYSECLQASGVTVAFVVWAINLFLDKRYLRASILISIGTLIQVLDGLDIMMVFSVIIIIQWLTNKTTFKQVLVFIGLFAVTAGSFLVLILYAKSGNSNLDNETLFKILFSFRHPHHFIFEAFPKVKTIVFFILAFIGLVFYAKRSAVVFQYLLLGVLGIAFYAVCTSYFHIIFIGNFQFYKISEWMKFFGVVALFGYAEMWFAKWATFKFGNAVEQSLIVLVIALSLTITIKFNSYLPYSVPHQIFALKQQEDIITICEAIKDNTPNDAVFIQPFDNTELKYYAQRSSYVEFKANVRHKSYVGEWYSRVHQVFGIGDDLAVQGFKLQQQADEHFYHLSIEELNTLKQNGVTHVLTKKQYPLTEGVLILSNNTYAVYQL